MRLDSVRCDSVRLDTVRYDSVQLDSVRYDSVRLDTAWCRLTASKQKASCGGHHRRTVDTPEMSDVRQRLCQTEQPSSLRPLPETVR